MAYSTRETCQVSRVNYFSSPDVTYNDRPTGNSENDNVQCIRSSMVRLLNSTLRTLRSLGWRRCLVASDGFFRILRSVAFPGCERRLVVARVLVHELVEELCAGECASSREHRP